MLKVKMQSEGRGEKAHPVECKRVKFFPQKDKRTGQVTGFGILGIICLKVLFENEHGDEFSLIWSTHSRVQDGSFKFRWPGRMEHPPERDFETNRAITDRKGRIIRDQLAPKVLVPGECQSFETVKILMPFLIGMIGEAEAKRLMGVMGKKMIDECAKEIQRKLEKAQEKADKKAG